MFFDERIQFWQVFSELKSFIRFLIPAILLLVIESIVVPLSEIVPALLASLATLLFPSSPIMSFIVLLVLVLPLILLVGSLLSRLAFAPICTLLFECGPIEAMKISFEYLRGFRWLVILALTLLSAGWEILFGSLTQEAPSGGPLLLALAFSTLPYLFRLGIWLFIVLYFRHLFITDEPPEGYKLLEHA